MCGINGILHLNANSSDSSSMDMERLLQGMCNQMIHRGPDDDGIHVDARGGLGFRRLSIIDTEGAHQPLKNEDGTIFLVCNGEIYNYLALRKELEQKGHQLSTQGDAETVLHLYEEYGFDCVNHLRGMFAFIIWDTRTQTLFGARDHFGIKPFYYTYDHERLVCSSELKSIISTKPGKWDIDVQGLYHYLSFQYVPEPRTMIDGVKKLPPGHRLIARGQDVHVERYWKPQFQSVQQDKQALAKKIRATFDESVELHLQSDVPVGCFLSSGVDSTAITAKVSQLKKTHSFSVGFEGNNNELPFSRETAQILKTEHHEWLITEQDYFDALPSCIHYQDDPVADPSAVALNLVSKMASEYVTVVLSGEGADELFGGYRIYQEPDALRYLSWMPDKLKQGMQSLLGNSRSFYGKNYLMRATTPLEQRFIGNAKIFTDDIQNVLGPQLLADLRFLQDAFEWSQQYYQEAAHGDDVTKMQTVDMNLWLPGNILAKGDKMSMAHSLELRVPFLDREMFAVAQSIPTEYKVNRQTTKAILREALSDLVPQHIINRAKLGFPIPIAEWLKGKRGDECLAVIKSSGIDAYINIPFVESLMDKHRRGEGNFARKIWTIYIFAQWYQTYVKQNDQLLVSVG
ncbi:asparagine synthase (glutamine-hydrolyzing) [Bacillus horti]|uniref:asparagine synthase (glutamine-hydrolyzing) n=1 Tax=Caldalkalibacillus horti TaxID=77523 RepID=A0ABT9VZA1_9BACI|nr:asparagine synthase (glutamine-hydrolyzing) [Bacillus horti]MDQ0166321.1 asparagine synthase (glutamine-hydrolyzing) [Bacillus horti]